MSKKNWARRLMTCVASGLIAASMFAVPAYRGWQSKTLTDGSQVTIRLVGDEFYHYWETEDGQIAVEQADGTFVLTNDSKPSANEIAKKRTARKSFSRPRKAIGERNLAPRGLIILVQFSNDDAKFKSGNNNAAFNDMMNKAGYDYNGATGSAVDYFKAQSNNAYSPVFDVIGPVTLNNTLKYYGEQGMLNGSKETDLYLADFVIDAVTAAENIGCDFSKYDGDNDGYVDIVYFIHAGKGQADGGTTETIWPHNWELSSALYYDLTHGTSEYYCTDEGYNLPKFDNKYIDNYACSAELRGTGDRSGIGTFCHEFSHVLGLPDYYDADEEENGTNTQTPQEWSIMDYGSYNNGGNTPPNYSMYDKYFMGWATPKFLAKNGEGQNITLTTGYNDAYQISGGTSLVDYTYTGTVYYFENRQKSGWDAYLPGSGMIVWQVKYNANIWENNAPNNTAGNARYTIVPADGKTSNYGYASDAFPQQDARSITPYTGCALTEIQKSGSNITFKYNGGVQKTECTYEIEGANCTVPEDGVVATNNALSLTIQPNSGYTLADAGCWMVAMGLNDLVYGKDFTYNASTGEFRIEKVTDDVTILVEGKQEFTLQWMSNGSLFTQTQSVGTVVLPENEPVACEGMTFTGWCKTANYSSENVAPTYVKTGDDTNQGDIFYAVFAESSDEDEPVEDILTNANTIKSASETYESWTASATSPAVYSGQSAGNYTTIQLRTSNNNSGIVTTTSGGTIAKVSVIWNSKTLTDRRLDIYGKHTPYSAPTDLYGNAGMLLGSIENGTSELVIDGEYKYIGIRSNNNALYLEKITITWGKGATYSNYSTVCSDIEQKTYTIGFYNNGVLIGEKQTVTKGQAAVVPANPNACDGYTFAGWSKTELATDNTVKPTYVTNFKVTKDQNYYAVFTKGEEPENPTTGSETVSDKLTRSITGISGNSYGEWTGKSLNSPAIYAGLSAGDNDAIQLRSNSNNSGIVTTKSGGNISKITVVWESHTSSGRKLDVYGKNSAFSKPSEMYSSTTRGTKLGTITKGTNTELEIKDDYAYVGIRSYDGAMYLSSVTFTWKGEEESSSVTYYTTSPDCTPQEECELAGIELNTENVKKKFITCSTFNYEGLVVTAKYDNCIDRKVTAQVTVEAPDMSTPGTKTVIVTYTENGMDEDATYQITVADPAVYTVRFIDNSKVISTQQVTEGEEAEQPEDPQGEEGYTFVGWWTEGLATDNTEAHAWVNDFTVTGNQDYYAVYAHKGSGSAPVEDAIVLKTTGVDGTAYKNWTATIGSATYAGISAGGNNSVQLNNTQKSGIVTTVSGGKISKVVVEWNGNTADGNTLDIYGKNVAYEATSDLYDESKKGTLIGSITFDKPASSPAKMTQSAKVNEYTISGDYEFIGLRSKKGALYLNRITITWSTETTTYTSSIIDAPTGVENIQSDNVQCTKILRDGQLYIMYKGIMYNVQGARVK